MSLARAWPKAKAGEILSGSQAGPLPLRGAAAILGASPWRGKWGGGVWGLSGGVS